MFRKRIAASIVFLSFISLFFLSCSLAKTSNEVQKDTTPPVLTVSTLTNGQEIGQNYILAGSVSDSGSGADKVFIMTDTNDWIAVDPTNGNWSLTCSVSNYGFHTNRLYASDKAGNQSATIQIIVERTSIPFILINSPAYGSTTNQSNITLAGAAGVDSPYTLSIVEISQNNGAYAAASGTTAWSKGINLQEGTNTFSARAISSSGKTNTISNWIVVLDLPLPSVTIDAPADGLLTNSKTIPVNGTATIDSPYSISRIDLIVNTTNTVTVSIAANWTAGSVAILEGTNRIQARAVGNDNKTNYSGTIIIICDTSAPALTVDNLFNNDIRGLSFTVSGTASDPNGVVGIYLSVNGGPYSAAIGTNAWSCPLTLSEGTYDLSLFARDVLGNCSVTNRLTNVQVKNAVYVSSGGSDLNSGTKDYPLLNLSKAVSNAVLSGIENIFVDNGVFTPGSGLDNGDDGLLLTNSNIKLIGGFVPGFAYRSGYSILNGSNTPVHVVTFRNASNIMMDGFQVQGGMAVPSLVSNDRGGGVYVSNSTYITLTNMLLVSNTAYYFGGGICIDGGHNNRFSGISRWNVLTGWWSYNPYNGGGGMCLFQTVSNTVTGLFDHNNGYTSSSALYLYFSDGNTIDCSIISNIPYGITGHVPFEVYYSTYNRIRAVIKYHSDDLSILVSRSANNYFDLDVNNNSGSSYAGIFASTNCLITGTVSGNGGIGIRDNSGVSNTFSNMTVTCNSNMAVELFISYAPKLLNCVLTNNAIASKDYVIHLWGSSGPIMISNCLIGGSSNLTTGIQEYTSIYYSDTVGHLIMNNTFLTNRLKYLYHDYVNGNTTDINQVNSTNYSKASVASGNTATNLP